MFKLTIAVAAVGIVALVIYARVAPVGGDALGYSVRDHVGASSVMPADCHETSPGRWACEVFDSETSSGVAYVVRQHGHRCYTARRSSANIALPRQVAGCLGVWDRVRLLDRL